MFFDLFNSVNNPPLEGVCYCGFSLYKNPPGVLVLTCRIGQVFYAGEK